ncbi:hypothetical protein NA57DRAFT_59286 [Rhizodiscina lignyota]|uniref:Uncharacterized protein n=1 Tax=Rhizodiscina lignyota TaxID=1504668 RepID=A0A9P4I751_9PEZI|nr:hypothetical protein NA57DRAFT_59286 [Rhizodiscina lignyota]
MHSRYIRSLRTASPALQIRSPVFYPAALQIRAASSNAQASPEASPGTASNVRPTNPTSSSSDAGKVNSSRATDASQGSPDTKSAQTPVSNPSQSSIGQQEEPQPSQENVKRDPNEPAESKRQAVESEGQKPLDPADK